MGRKAMFNDEYHSVQREKMRESRKKRMIEVLERKIAEQHVPKIEVREEMIE